MKLAKCLFRTLLILISFGLVQEGFAQTDLMIGQYKEVLPYYNPSFIYSKTDLHLSLLHNRQLEGIDGVSKSFLFMAEMPIDFLGLSNNVGLRLQNQSIGLFKDNELSAYMASSWAINKELKLSFGLGLSMIASVFNGAKVYIPSGGEGHSQADESIPQSSVSGKGFDAQLGASLYYKDLSLGFGLRNLLSIPILLGKKYQRQAVRNYNLYLMYNFSIKNTFLDLTPSVFASLDEQLLYRVDTNFDICYSKRFLAGMMYRFGQNALGLRLGVILGKFQLNYQFEYPFNGLGRQSYGTHELVLSYSLPVDLNKRKKGKYKSIRLL